jgi:hypothetical protein
MNYKKQTTFSMFKKCKICQLEKEGTQFNKNCNSPDGLGCYCKECSRIRQTKRYNTIPEVREKLKQQSKDNSRKNYKENRIKKIKASKDKPWRRLLYSITHKAQENLGLKCPCDLKSEELKIYIENLFIDGMAWGNYGDFWEIRRTKVLSEFVEPKEEVALLINKHTNLHPVLKSKK